ncbi:MAG TPA: diadenylate cyclase CdaA [Bryobacteraceae bacterium]|nr:diadenylate cyclase CdaA [Bryobacteraceae bacterium]
MLSLSTPIHSAYPQLTYLALLDIFLVAFLIYQFFMIVRGRRAAHILAGVLVLAVLYAVSIASGLAVIGVILANLAPYAPFALIVMFQSEIRRLLARIGRRRWLSLGSRLQKREFIEETVLAITQLSQQKTGALVVVERDIGLRSFIESGVRLDSCISRDLLLTIFMHPSLLHDGAVILQGDRIAAAACFLPLTAKPAIARSLGTRHRAAIGVTEETDCLSIVVSEETGRISIAAFGEIEMDVAPERLVQRVTDHLVNKRQKLLSKSRDWVDREEERYEREAARDAHAD